MMHRAALILLGFSGLAGPLSLAQTKPELDAPPEMVGPNQWRVSWESVPGAIYRLERSTDLQSWTAVDLVQADQASTALVDPETPNEDKVFWRVVWVGNSGNLKPKLVPPFEQLPNNDWRVTWTSVPGLSYTLERSFDLETWEEVETINAVEDLTSLIDDALNEGHKRVFWRVALNGVPPDDEGLVVSGVQINAHFDGDQSTVRYSVLAGGSESVQEVVFFDGETEIGSARQAFGDSWTLVLPWDPDAPATPHIRAVVTTEEGSTEETEVQSFLLADPSTFIPLSTEGRPLYGQFVEAGADGMLGPFLYHPEGLTESSRSTGVHFEFAAGAQVVTNGPANITFTEGTFFRGPTDPSPLVVGGGAPRMLPLDNLEPTTIAAAYDLPEDQPITLQWGESEITWHSGELGSDGWSNLQVDLSLGSFVLPGDRLNASVTQDPESGELYLVVCYFGSWAPISNGVAFTIPPADPLKIYLSSTGEFAAHGTAVATFPDGAVARGSLAWREPVFEFRFEGKNIVIRGLDQLRPILPDNPEDCIPAGATTAELDELEKCLTGYQSLFRGLATGAAGQGDPANPTTFAPLPSPTDQAGAALEAWAGRIASWEADRTGQVLSEAEGEELVAVIRKAAKTAESAHDPLTTVTLLSHFLMASNNLESAFGAGPVPSTLRDQFSDAEQRMLAAFARTIEERAEFNRQEELTSLGKALPIIADLLEAGAAPAPDRNPDAPAPASDPASLERFRAAVEALTFKVPRGRYLRPDVAEMSSSQLLKLMQNMLVVVEFLRAQRLASSINNLPDGFTEIRPLYLQAKSQFGSRQDAAFADYLSNRDYLQLREIVARRARLFVLTTKLGDVLTSDPDLFFSSRTPALIGEFAEQLDRLPNRQRVRYCAEDWQSLERIKLFTSDHGNAADIGRAWIDLVACNDLIKAASKSGTRCDDLSNALLRLQPPVRPLVRPNGDEHPTAYVTGRYESLVEAPRPGEQETFVTMQLHQAGRYISGGLQWQQGRSYDRYRVEGLLVSTSSAGVPFSEYGCRLVEIVDGQPAGTEPEVLFGMIEIENGLDGVTAVLQEDAIFGTVAFLKVTNMPVFSEAIIRAVDPDLQKAVGAAHLRPMHSLIASRVANKALQLKFPITRFFNVDGAPQTEVASIESGIGDILRLVTDEQVPAARAIASQMLTGDTFEASTSRFGLGGLGAATVTRTFWDALATLFVLGDRSMPNASKLLGVIPDAIKSANTFRYDITIEQVTGGAAVAGGADITVTIVKTDLENNVSSEPFRYDGTIGGLSVGPGAGVVRDDDSATIFSPFNWTEEDFAGELQMHQAAGGFAFGDVGVSIVFTGAFEFIGNGRFPPLKMKLETGAVKGYQIGGGVDIQGGILVPKGLAADPTRSLLFDEVVSFNATADATFDQAVYFDTNLATLTDCGWQYLRAFVAEHRALFDSPRLDILIEGMTDTTGPPDFNQTLSADRALAVEMALRAILGPSLQGTITAVGYGETPANETIPIDTVDEGIRDAVARLREETLPSPDSTPNPLWRRADITVNGRITTRIFTP